MQAGRLFARILLGLSVACSRGSRGKIGAWSYKIDLPGPYHFERASDREHVWTPNDGRAWARVSNAGRS
jgi:hypothetical protein